MTIYLWLDDIRPIPQKILNFCNENRFSVIRASSSYEAKKFFTQLIREDDIYLVDFDYNLGGGEEEDENGYDFAKWLLDNEIEPQYFTIHTVNPIGARNIHQLLTHYDWQYLNFWI